MIAPRDIRIAVVGAGISGITAAHMLAKNGYKAVVFDKLGEIGGVWAVAYPEVRVQNIAEHYRLSDFPWPFAPDFHPTAAQILRYWREVVDHLQLDIRLNNEVLALEAEDDGVQLYRHLIHPSIPLVGFAGFNHGFMQVPGVEIGTLWLCAQLRGELELPSVEEMEESIEQIRFQD